ncbi:MAG: ribosome small subunit-dependent GTPase A [Ignavibacteriales bacterium]
MNLDILGWNPYWQAKLNDRVDSDHLIGRISAEHKQLYRVYTDKGELLARVSGRLRYNALGRPDYPAVGDWVIISAQLEGSQAVIVEILPRRTKISRQMAGDKEEEQILASNVDAILIVMALNRDFNLRRLERYLVLAWESGAEPVVVLNKADLCIDIHAKIAAVNDVAPGVSVHAISCESGQGLEAIKGYFRTGQTSILLGSSGVGKSTLLNILMGNQVQKTQGIREDDDRGRHTTTHRQMHILPRGGLVIDSPGLRELQLWVADAGFTSTFEDIAILAEECHFADCTHQGEPDCAVIRAIEEGVLDEGRFDSYLKLQKELAYVSRKENMVEALENKQKWKTIAKDIKRFYKNK